MRRSLTLLALAACGGDDVAFVDAPAAIDAAVVIDAPIDAAACDPMLLAGGNDLAAQGWTVVSSGNATVTYGNTVTRLETTAMSGNLGSHQLVSHAALPAPYTLRFELVVESVGTHNSFDAPVAILGAFTPPYGLPAERAQMIYVDGARLGWADDSQAFAFDALDGADHTYELAVDAAGAATVRVDGALALTRAGFVPGGAFALGDQTNEVGLESAILVRSVTRVCP